MKNYKKFKIQLGLIITVLFIIACNQKTSKVLHQNIDPQKHTQAILKVQDFAYDNDNKKKVSGRYIHKQSIMVPKELSGQNKWIMFEGPVLENDKIAYRYYADARHRYDIYAKKVPDLVMDTVSWNYHNIMDWGSDILKVGNSLGMGSPGIYYKDTIYTLSNWASKEIQVLENGNDKSVIRTIFKGLKIEDHTFDIIEDWSIETGNFYCEIELSVIEGQLPAGMYFATGIVKHLPNASIGQVGNGLYAFTFGEQSYHDQNMGMAVMANESYSPRDVENDLSHLYIFENSKKGVKYRFMSVWSEGLGAPKTTAEFKNHVEKACSTL